MKIPILLKKHALIEAIPSKVYAGETLEDLDLAIISKKTHAVYTCPPEILYHILSRQASQIIGSAMGKKGGAVSSEAKTKAARLNIRKRWEKHALLSK